MKEGIKFTFIFIYVFLLQVLVLENVHGIFWFHPFVYLFFLLYLTPDLPKWASVLIGFFIGFIFDIFLNSFGIHASACLLVGLLKPYLAAGNINLAPAREEEKGSWLNKGKFRFKMLFLIVFILMHHFVVFFFEMLGQNLTKTFMPTWLGSSLATFVIILISEELFFKTFKSKL